MTEPHTQLVVRAATLADEPLLLALAAMELGTSRGDTTHDQSADAAGRILAAEAWSRGLLRAPHPSGEDH